MGNTRRHFLRTISGVAALPAISSVLITEPCSLVTDVAGSEPMNSVPASWCVVPRRSRRPVAGSFLVARVALRSIFFSPKTNNSLIKGLRQRSRRCSVDYSKLLP